MKTLSIIIPAYNEEKTILEVLKEVIGTKVPLKKEIIIVNDGSKDKTLECIQNFMKKMTLSREISLLLINKENGGKGSAVRKGIKVAKGDFIMIQDADLEYNPSEYSFLLKPLLEGKAEVVYGSRFLNKNHSPRYRLYYAGNVFLSIVTTLLYGQRITDMETCYKVFSNSSIKGINLVSNKFDIEPEITAKIIKQGIKIKEVPISYSSRSFSEGKKITWRDGLSALKTLLYWRFFST